MNDAEKLTGLSLVGFGEELAAKRSVPGGGGAAAYVGALAAALCSMVGQFTLGKKRYAAYEGDVRRMLDSAEDLRVSLTSLVDEDARAFFPLSQAYGLPKEDPSRAQVLEEATKGASKVPLQMMEAVAQAIDLLEEMGQKGSRMLVSDVGTGALLARAALEAASLNVFVNTRTLTDRAFAQKAEERADQLLDAYVPKAEALEARVMASIRDTGEGRS